jgi:hypothetical protein
MKKMLFMAVMMVMTISANAMSYNAAKNEALFLSDKMAYELNLTAAQYEDVYEINLDYLLSVNGRNDVLGPWWDRRNADLRYVLTAWQYDKYVTLAHFYRPVAWKAGSWTFAVYSHYNRGHFYKALPTVYVTYKGGNNHKHATHYADRKPIQPTHGNSSTWRNTDRGHNGTAKPNTKPNGNNGHNNHIAQNTHTNRHNNSSGHFGGHR